MERLLFLTQSSMVLLVMTSTCQWNWPVRTLISVSIRLLCRTGCLRPLSISGSKQLTGSQWDPILLWPIAFSLCNQTMDSRNSGTFLLEVVNLLLLHLVSKGFLNLPLSSPSSTKPTLTTLAGGTFHATTNSTQRQSAPSRTKISLSLVLNLSWVILITSSLSMAWLPLLEKLPLRPSLVSAIFWSRRSATGAVKLWWTRHGSSEITRLTLSRLKDFWATSDCRVVRLIW